jgi:hypothetical protein
MKKMTKTPLAVAMGAALISSVTATAANAEANPFDMTELSSGYMQLAEMKCGEAMGMPGMKPAEGNCAGAKTPTADSGKKAEGKCGTQCGEGMKQCSDAKAKEGACGDKMKGCGEGMQGCAEMQKGKEGGCAANMKHDAPAKK